MHDINNYLKTTTTTMAMKMVLMITNGRE